MGVASGGVFKTTDAGATWVPITDGKVPVASTGSIAVAESDPNIIYLGTGSDDIRSNVSTGRGVYKSTDGGQTWSFVGLYDAGQIGAVRIHPTNPNIAWVAAIGERVQGERRTRRLQDDRRRQDLEKVLFVSDSTGAADIEINPANPDIVYAWMWRGERKPWTIISGANATGSASTRAPTAASTSRRSRTAADGARRQGEPRRHGGEPEPRLRARRGEAGRRPVSLGRRGPVVEADEHYAQLITRPFYYDALAADPTNADVVYAGAEKLLQVDGRRRELARMRTPHGDNHDMWINPNNGQIMIQSNDGGANVSLDGGRTWSTQKNQPTAEIYGVWLDEQFPYRLYGAQQDASTVIVPSLPVRRADGAVRGRARAARRARSCRIRRIRTSFTARARDSSAACA